MWRDIARCRLGRRGDFVKSLTSFVGKERDVMAFKEVKTLGHG